MKKKKEKEEVEWAAKDKFAQKPQIMLLRRLINGDLLRPTPEELFLAFCFGAVSNKS